MDAELIARWNEVVGPEDVVYHLGDFTLSGKNVAKNYLRRLDGMILMLRYPWHHDRRWLPSKNSQLWTRTSTVGFLSPLEVLRIEDYPPITLCHFPLETWPHGHHGAWHLHGHSHGKLPMREGRLDVGVDSWDFAPVSLERIAEELK